MPEKFDETEALARALSAYAPIIRERREKLPRLPEASRTAVIMTPRERAEAMAAALPHLREQILADAEKTEKDGGRKN